MGEVPPTHSASGRVLVVDDDDGVRMTVSRMRREHEVVQASCSA